MCQVSAAWLSGLLHTKNDTTALLVWPSAMVADRALLSASLPVKAWLGQSFGRAAQGWGFICYSRYQSDSNLMSSPKTGMTRNAGCDGTTQGAAPSQRGLADIVWSDKNAVFDQPPAHQMKTSPPRKRLKLDLNHLRIHHWPFWKPQARFNSPNMIAA